MTRPVSTSRLLLVADRRGAAAAAPVIPLRRYRLARLRLGAPRASAEARFGYLKRIHD